MYTTAGYAAAQETKGNLKRLAAEFLGWSVESMRDKPQPFFNLVEPEGLSMARETLGHIMEGRNVREVSVRLIRKDGTRVPIAFSAVLKGKVWFWFARKLPAESAVPIRE